MSVKHKPDSRDIRTTDVPSRVERSAADRRVCHLKKKKMEWPKQINVFETRTARCCVRTWLYCILLHAQRNNSCCTTPLYLYKQGANDSVVLVRGVRCITKNKKTKRANARSSTGLNEINEDKTPYCSSRTFQRNTGQENTSRRRWNSESSAPAS